MKDTEDRADLETVSAIIAELKADATPLAKDLVKGINAYLLVEVMSLFLTVFTSILIAFLAFPQYYSFLNGNLFLLAPFSAYPAVGVWIAFKTHKKYVTLRNKYSRLIEVSEKLGD